MRMTSGIKLLKEQEGHGPDAQNGDQCIYHWRVFLNRGEEIHFDAIHIRRFEEGLYPHEPRPNTRLIGSETVIDRTTTLGRREAFSFIHNTLRGMKVGGYRKVRISPHLRFGKPGLPEYGIPHDAVLIVEIWLHAIQPKSIQRNKDPYFGFDPHFFGTVMDTCSQELQTLGLHTHDRTTLSMPLSKNFSGWVYLTPSTREPHNRVNIDPMIGVWFAPHLQIWNEIMDRQTNRAPICRWLGHLMPDDAEKYFAFSVESPIKSTAQELATAVKQYGFPFMKDVAQPEPYLEHVRLHGSKIHNAPMLATLYYVLNEREKMLETLNRFEKEGRQKNRQDGGFKEYLQFSKKFLAYLARHPMHPS